MLLFAIIFSASAFAQSAEDLIAEGDKLVKEYKHQDALDVYQKADSLYPNNWEVLWRISRAYVDIAEKMPKETSEEEDAQLEIYDTALALADSSVKLAPDKSEPLLRKAIAGGRIALFKGVFSVAGVVNQVRDDAEKAIELNTGGNEIQGVTHYVLARTHAKISEKWAPARSVLGLGWADIDSAMVHYKKAVNLYPNFIMIYVDYAKSLIEEDEYELAREMLNKAVSLPKIDEDDEERIAEAKALLIEIEDE
ncbi:MAG: tetratricopeptide repeat protein [Ignavibacteriae bacterium]|nr:tetratricopeptide repeat protein [Ignavibacteriota bacterium]NOG98470.1 tetratricopeptide repeat protein [Ignavibacteriota bacterium]